MRIIKRLDEDDITKEFKIYKLVCGGNCECIEVESLGDVTLFLGDNHSISILASTSVGCNPNYIYFYDDFFNYYNFFGGPLHFFLYSTWRIEELQNIPYWITCRAVWCHFRFGLYQHSYQAIQLVFSLGIFEFISYFP